MDIPVVICLFKEFAVINTMDRTEFLKQCRFPKEWRKWNMLPARLLEKLYQLYQSDAQKDVDNEDFRKFRLEAFFFWLEGDLTKDQIKKLFRLSFPETTGEHLRSSINRHKDCTEPLRKALFGYTTKEIPKFNISKLAELLHFPKEWLMWRMYPNELFLAHRKEFQPGDEASSENNRNRAFHYWLSRELKEEQLIKLVKLTLQDPDPLMAEDIQPHIKKHKNCTDKIKKFLQQRS